MDNREKIMELEKTKQYLDDYERTIIVMIVGDRNNKRNQIIKSLEPEMFTNKIYSKIFKVIKTIALNGDDVNVYSIMEVLTSEEQKRLVQELDKEYLSNVNWQYYTKSIVECYIQRLVEKAKSFNELHKIAEIKRKYMHNAPILTHISKDALDLVEKYYDSMETSIFTGFSNLDGIIGSFQRGDYVILAGATSSGKSLFMTNLALKMAREQQKRVDIFTLEMKKEQLVNRIVCSELGLNANGFRTHDWTPQQVNKYAEYLKNCLNDLPIQINNTGKMTLNEVVAAVKKSDADVVFIDYLGLIRHPEVKNKYDKISEISMELKALALDANKVMIVLHQLSRMQKDRKSKMPQLSDLRDSGQIEQDADVVLFVYRPAYYFPDQPKDLMQIAVAKDRNGSLGVADLTCNLAIQKIYNRIDTSEF